MRNNTLAPVSPINRIAYLDVLRGFAILGIFIANLEWFSFYSIENTGNFIFPEIDHLVRFLQIMLIDGKFYSIFSVLFGWGIALQIRNSVVEDIITTNFIRRRLRFMMLFGAIHLVILWEGDIVFFYALLGFILLAMRHFSTPKLILIAIILLLSPPLLYFLKIQFPILNTPAEKLKNIGEYIYHYNGLINQDQSRTQAYLESNSIFRNIDINIGDAPYRFAYLISSSRTSKVLGAMIIGFVIERCNLYNRSLKNTNKLLPVVAVIALLALPCNYLLADATLNPLKYNNFQDNSLFTNILSALGVFPLAFLYMLILAWGLQIKQTRKLLLHLAPVGKMAFSNYIIQTLIGIFVFYNTGLGWMTHFGPATLTLFAFLVFTLQVTASTIWLNYFRFGPIEWAWRSLTYKKSQPLKRNANNS